MPKRNLFIPNQYYHLYNRGAGGGRIFFDDKSYQHCLDLLFSYLLKYQIHLIAFCLMPTHYHFLLRQDSCVPLSKLMSTLFNAYVQWINYHYNRTGTLFEGRFKDKHVDNENYLRHLCRYIHANPVKAGLVCSPEEWRYSNYAEWIGERNGRPVDRTFINAYFIDRTDYQSYLHAYLHGIDELPEDIKAYLLDL